MKKSIIVLFLTALTFLFSVCSASAANWTYVGSLQLASGKSRTDYIDAQSITMDRSNKVLTFWVLSEQKDPEAPEIVRIRKMTKYMTKLEINYPTKVLEWKAYIDYNNGKTTEMSFQKPDSGYIYPEAYSLLNEAVEIAEALAN